VRRRRLRRKAGRDGAPSAAPSNRGTSPGGGGWRWVITVVVIALVVAFIFEVVIVIEVIVGIRVGEHGLDLAGDLGLEGGRARSAECRVPSAEWSGGEW